MAINETIERKVNMNNSDENIQQFNLSEVVSLPKEYYSIDKPKQHIAKSIKFALDQKNLSLRKFSTQVDGMSYPSNFTSYKEGKL